MMFIPSFMIIFSLLVFSILLASFSSSWLSLWFSLELNMLMFLPLISFSGKMYELENSMKYFLVQSIASLWFLFGMLIFSLKLYIVQVMVLLSMMMKLGVFPFHGWFFSIMGVASWKFLFLFSTFQKFIPLIILSNSLLPMFSLGGVIGMTLLFILSMGTSFLSARLVLTLSSLNNVSWMLLSLQSSCTFWLVYMGLYMTLLIPVVGFLSSLSLPYSGLFFSANSGASEKFLFSSCIFSLGGLPPFLGFFNKFMMIKLIMSQVSLFLIMLIILSSLFLLFYYLSLVFSSLSVYPSSTIVSKPSMVAKLSIAMVLSFLMIFFLMFIGI